jgi:dethiobiotin synthetase
MSLFLTGTDTNAGKTYAACLLLRALRRSGLDAVGMKPLCCGGREDAEALHAAAEGAASLNRVNPVWLRAPVAPYVASLVENRAIDLALIRENFTALRAAHAAVLVEGVGGWLVPITSDYFVCDLAREMALPVAVVVANRLGALNHALLTVHAIRAQGLECAGFILNNLSVSGPEKDIARTTNRAVLETLLEVPLLLEIACGQTEIELTPALRRLFCPDTHLS